MNSKQEKILRAIFEKPTKGDIRWSDIESLFRSLGCEIVEGSGSRIRVIYGEKRGYFHRPHPRPTTVKGVVDSVREFLKEIGKVP